MKKYEVATSAKLYQIIIILCFTILIFRLFWLQIIQHHKYSTLAENNRIRIEAIYPNRGKILDRNGIILADNRQSFQYIHHINQAENINDQLPFLHKCLPYTTDLNTLNNQSVISRKLSSKELVCLAFYNEQTPSFRVEPRLIRTYRMGKATSHLLGYMAPITTAQIASLTSAERKSIIHMGRSGIEMIYETELRGTAGWRQEEVNAKGKKIRQMDQINAKPGKDIVLTLNAKLQTFAYEALGEHVGAFVVIDPNNGDLLAIASTPSFNANEFSYGIPSTLYKSLLNDPLKPLYHRATQGLYPPASTIKPYYALAGMEENIVKASDTIYDKGWFTLENSKHVFHNWRRSGQGTVDLERAISVSCDTYFYRLAVKLGIDKMSHWLNEFGFGQSIASPLSQRSGLVPTPEWKKSRKLTWTPGDTVITGIGQGSLLVTPIQAALTVSRLAMRGRGHELRLRMDKDPIALKPILAKKDSWDHVINGMRRVVTDPDGTARTLNNIPIAIAAKTGTAQVVSLERHQGKRKHQDHNWVVGFAPIQNPKIAFAVLIEHEHVATKVAEKFLRQWVELENISSDSSN